MLRRLVCVCCLLSCCDLRDLRGRSRRQRQRCIRDRTSSTITNAAAAVIYNTSEANDPLIAYVDFGGNFSTTSGTFQIVWNASGVFTLDTTP